MGKRASTKAPRMAPQPNPDWTLPEAQAASEAALAADLARTWNDPALPLFQWFALQTLATLRAQFEAGERGALLAAIRKCANHDLLLPAWVANAYIAGYDDVLCGRIRSWDAALGTLYPKGTHLHDLRKRRALSAAVPSRILAIRKAEPDTPLDEALFERVGREFNIGRTLTAELYYAAPAALRASPAPPKPRPK